MTYYEGLMFGFLFGYFFAKINKLRSSECQLQEAKRLKEMAENIHAYTRKMATLSFRMQDLRN